MNLKEVEQLEEYSAKMSNCVAAIQELEKTLELWDGSLDELIFSFYAAGEFEVWRRTDGKTNELASVLLEKDDDIFPVIRQFIEKVLNKKRKDLNNAKVRIGG